MIIPNVKKIKAEKIGEDMLLNQINSLSLSHVSRIVTTYDAYIALPKSERERRVWFWPTPWYKTLWSYTWNLSEKESESDKVDRHIRENYPIQYWVREKSLDLLYCLRDLKYRTIALYHDWICGHRTEMRKAVFPRHYTDLVEMIVTFHIQVLIEYVEREEALAHHDYSTNESDRLFRDELWEHYDFASRTRKKMIEAIDAESWRAFHESREDGATADTYKKLTEMENELMDRDTKMCEWVVRNRNQLWT